MGQYIQLATRIGGLLVLIVALFYFFVLWALADLIRVQLSIEEGVRATASGVTALRGHVSAEDIGTAVAAALEPTLSAIRAEAARERVAAPVERSAPTPFDVAPTVPEAGDLAAPTVTKEAVAAAAVAAAGAPGPKEEVAELPGEVAAEKAEEVVSQPEQKAEAPVAVAEAVVATVEVMGPAEVAVPEPAPAPVAEAEGVGEEDLAPAEVAGMVEAVAEAPQEVAVPVADIAEDVAAEAEAGEVSVAQAQPVEAAVAAVDQVGEAKAKAKEALDRSLEQAARQMADLESALAAAVAEAWPEGGDDLAEISGIGPVFRVRLRQAGISTYAALAAATPEQLAEITEQSAERIVRDDWIGQAERKLAVG